MASRKQNKRKTRRMKGGSYMNPATYVQSDSNPYTTYNVNTYENDPSRTIQSARNLVGGGRTTKTGRRKTGRRKTGRRKTGRTTLGTKKIKMRGGSFLSQQFNNPISTFGDSFGSLASADILKGSLLSSSAPYINPINTPYGNHNPALI